MISNAGLILQLGDWMTSPFKDPDLLSIQRFKADVFVITKDSIRFIEEGNEKFPFIALLDPRIYRGNIDILEDAVRNKKKLWLVIEVKTSSPNALPNHGFSSTGKVRYLSDARYVNDSDEMEKIINPSKR